MLSYIKGTLIQCGEDSLVVEAGNLGYHLYVTALTASRLPGRGSEVKLYTHLYIKEDNISLYGFADQDELQVFRLLLGVNGIGPRGAVAILSLLSPDTLRFAVAAADVKSISKAPGIGKKTAERIILELRDKLKLEDALEGAEESGVHVVEGNAAVSAKNEAVLALTALGYSGAEAMEALRRAAVTEDMDAEGMLKAALKQLTIL